MVADSISMPGRSAMDNVEMLYSRQVYVYNDHVIQGGVLPNLVDLMADATSSLDDKVNIMKEIEVWAPGIPTLSCKKPPQLFTMNASANSTWRGSFETITLPL